jgi:predicted DNA repair protein MutK
MPIVTVMKCAFPETLFVPSNGVRIQKHAAPACGSEKVALFRMLAKTFGVCANIAQGSFTEPGKSAARGRNRFRAARVASIRAGRAVWSDEVTAGGVMSGLLALLDDVAAIAKVAATSVDDVVAQATKAGTKAAGAVIDDAAVTPKYVHGFSAERELPIVWKIARGSIFNKLVILLPAALLLSAFAPWAIAPLLMLGGAYLCFEGAEKVAHWLSPPMTTWGGDGEEDVAGQDSAHLEEQKVKGAIKTDFILSAEIMTIALAAIETDSILFEAAALAHRGDRDHDPRLRLVALIVKADDFGLHLADRGASRGSAGRWGAGSCGGCRLPADADDRGHLAMLWVGGSIITHSLPAWAGTCPRTSCTTSPIARAAGRLRRMAGGGCAARGAGDRDRAGADAGGGASRSSTNPSSRRISGSTRWITGPAGTTSSGPTACCARCCMRCATT